jgi:hypothetical protein
MHVWLFFQLPYAQCVLLASCIDSRVFLFTSSLKSSIFVNIFVNQTDVCTYNLWVAYKFFGLITWQMTQDTNIEKRDFKTKLSFGASVRLVHPRTLFKPQVANCFATDRSKAVTSRVLIFVNCLWCLFWNWSFYMPCLFFLSSSWLCGEAVSFEYGNSWYAYFTFLFISGFLSSYNDDKPLSISENCHKHAPRRPKITWDLTSGAPVSVSNWLPALLLYNVISPLQSDFLGFTISMH